VFQGVPDTPYQHTCTPPHTVLAEPEHAETLMQQLFQHPPAPLYPLSHTERQMTLSRLEGLLLLALATRPTQCLSLQHACSYH
jgi:hypothetical protein